MTQPNIVSELKEKRTKFTKTFLLDDGSYTLTGSRRPLHYEDENGQLRNIDTKIKYRKVDKSVYEAKLNTKRIGYTITSKEDGCTVDVELIRIGNQEISYTKPQYEENKAIWQDVIPGIDIVIEFLPYKVKIWKMLKIKNAAHDIEFRITKDEECSLNLTDGVTANDNERKKVKIQSNVGESQTFEEKNKKRVQYSVTHIIEDSAIELDRKTRKRKRVETKYPLLAKESEIEYPISIDPNVIVPIDGGANDGGIFSWTSQYSTPTPSIDVSFDNTDNTQWVYDAFYYINSTYFGRCGAQAYFYFDPVTIPNNATINSAIIRAVSESDWNDQTSPVQLRIYANDNSNPTVPTTGPDITGASPLIGPESATDIQERDEHYVDMNVEPIVSELVGKYNYSSGKPMLFYIKSPPDEPNSTAWDNYNQLRFILYENTDGFPPPELIINYTPLGGSSSSTSASSTSMSTSSTSCEFGLDDDFTGSD